MSRARSKKTRKGKRVTWQGWGWLRTPAILVLALVPTLAILRATYLGFGTADLVGHLVLDLLVIGVFFPLFSNRVMAQSWESAYYGVALLCLSLYMGWLYLPSGFGFALFLFLLTLAAGGMLRGLRLWLWKVTFVRGDPFLDVLGRGAGKQRSGEPVDTGTWGAATTRTRYVALPVLIGLLGAFVAIRIARPLDKRAAAEPVLARNVPVEIGRQFLKSVTNGNAPLFAREHAVWYIAPDKRGEVMRQGAELFSSFKGETNRLALTWADLSTATTTGVTGADPVEVSEQRVVYELGRSVHAWLEDPEAVPAGARVTGRPGYGEILIWASPVRVELERQADGAWRVTHVGTSIALRLNEGAMPATR